MSITTPNYGAEPLRQSDSAQYSSAMTNAAMTLGLLVFFSPVVWFVAFVVQKHPSENRVLVGLLLSLALPVLVTLATSVVAFRQIHRSAVPLGGRWKAWAAIVLAVASPLFWAGLFMFLAR